MSKSQNIAQKLAILSISLLLASNNAISGSLIYIQHAFNLTRSNTEFIVTLASFSTMIFILLAEYIAQNIGMKKTVLLGLSLVSISGVIPVIFNSYPLILLSRVILGSGLGLFNGHSANYINLLYNDNDERTKLHALRNAAEFIGQIFLYTLAGILVQVNFIYTFLVYSTAIIIFIIFKINVQDVKLEKEKTRVYIDSNIFLFIIFAMIMILNMTCMQTRFPFVASLTRGMGINISFYLNLVPIIGMFSAILFTPINLKLREYTIFLGLFLYTLANILIIGYENSFWGFLSCILLAVFAQSLCMPYIFAEVPRYVRGQSSRLATNLIFIGCNVGVFMAPLFLSWIDKFLNTKSLSKGFIAFVIIHIILIAIFFYRNKMNKRNR
ncbi:MFS transporter [Anaerococcus porci]|uniref:MFS transporter n=1 Tax=Anaerococcus porci TaxID=2652269 RepID=A0A6N7VER0_9FIRM|nr:MFS transporter [Anaerococcus porci]MDY3006520.1 MFS transporter [Anaerococcus porci]MSS77905.1 MFS transporter [Anaerococcus porci]